MNYCRLLELTWMTKGATVFSFHLSFLSSHAACPAMLQAALLSHVGTECFILSASPSLPTPQLFSSPLCCSQGSLDGTDSLGSHSCLKILQKYNKHPTGELATTRGGRDDVQSHMQPARDPQERLFGNGAFV